MSAVRELPDQVRRHGEAAAAAEAALNPPPASPGNPAAPEPETPAPPVETTQAVTPTAPQPVAEDDVKAENRYKTLQGILRAEQARLNATISDLQSQLGTALAQLKIASGPAPAADTKPAVVNGKLITEKDHEAFGGDLLDLIKRQAQEIVTAERGQFQADLEKLQSENTELKQKLTGVAEKQTLSDRDRYFVELKKLVPTYETVNKDAGWLAWLMETDPLSGLLRQAYLDNAFNAMDVQRTANLFNAWLGVSSTPAQSTVTPSAEVQQELRSQVAPGTSRAAPVNVTPSEKVWTQAKIAEYYTDVTKGVYKGKDKEARAIEAEIDAAVASGRVR